MHASLDYATNTLTIILPMTAPKRSKRGRANLVATTHGFQDAGMTYHGKPLQISINAIIAK